MCWKARYAIAVAAFIYGRQGCMDEILDTYERRCMSLAHVIVLEPGRSADERAIKRALLQILPAADSTRRGIPSPLSTPLRPIRRHWGKLWGGPPEKGAAAQYRRRSATGEHCQPTSHPCRRRRRPACMGAAETVATSPSMATSRHAGACHGTWAGTGGAVHAIGAMLHTILRMAICLP